MLFDEVSHQLIKLIESASIILEDALMLYIAPLEMVILKAFLLILICCVSNLLLIFSYFGHDSLLCIMDGPYRNFSKILMTHCSDLC